MKYAITILLLFVMDTSPKKPYVDFTLEGRGREWMMVNDPVMGGRSVSGGDFLENGNLHWYGEISLQNNGGFASIRSPKGKYEFGKYTGMRIRMKGDGRKYGFTLRNVTYFNGISYTHYWPTEPDEWITVEVPFSEMVGKYFGEADPRIEELDPDKIREFGVILYDKKAGPFDVEIDWIDLYK